MRLKLMLCVHEKNKKVLAYFSSSSDHEKFLSHKAYLNVDFQHSRCLFRADKRLCTVDYYWKSYRLNAFEDVDDEQDAGASWKFSRQTP